VTVGSGDIDRECPGGRLTNPAWLLIVGFGADGDIVSISDVVALGV
jgi:hypothetical protein